MNKHRPEADVVDKLPNPRTPCGASTLRGPSRTSINATLVRWCAAFLRFTEGHRPEDSSEIRGPVRPSSR